MFFLVLVTLAVSAAPSTDDPDDAVLAALDAEVARAMASLDGEQAPYFIAAEVVETHRINLAGEEGALHGWSPSHTRHVDVDARIGSPQLDSSHHLRGGGRELRHSEGRALPLEDDPALLQHRIWAEVNDRVEASRERWGRVLSDKDVLVSEDPSLDLSPVEPVVALHEPAALDLDIAAWEQTIRAASSVIASSPVVHDGSVVMTAEATTSWLVTSEGTRVRHGRTLFRVFANVDTVAEDGAQLALHRSWDADSVDELPDAEAIIAGVAELQDLLAALREAPEQDPYTGPAILTDQAAGVFFHEIFGHRVEGNRLKRVDNAQTFRSMVGQPILPAFLSVYDDPTLAEYDGHHLRGHYLYDNEGVPGQRAVLVEDGVLRGFLQNRSPIEAGDASNGHGRRAPGKSTVTRQGNLVVEASESISDEALRERLRRLARAQGLEYGLVIGDIAGGFTFTGRGIPNAFQVNVLVAHRVYVDGRPDELVRGMDLIGTPLVTFERIAAAGELHEVFNGNCGAESGWVPVAAVAPALLVSAVETQRKAKAQGAPPLLDPPRSTPEEGS